MPSAPKATGAVLAMRDSPEAGERREAEADQDRARYGNRRAEARGALEEGAEREGDEQKLQPAIRGDAADRRLQGLERALLDRQPIEENDVENDPSDREKAGYRAEHGRTQRQTRRHGEDKDRHEIGDDERNNGGDMRLHLVGRDEHQQCDDRQGRTERRKNPVVEGIVNLIPHYTASFDCDMHRRTSPIYRSATRNTPSRIAPGSPLRRYPCNVRSAAAERKCVTRATRTTAIGANAKTLVFASTTNTDHAPEGLQRQLAQDRDDPARRHSSAPPEGDR